MLVFLMFLGGCGGELTDEELLQRDKDELASNLNSNKVLSYKFIKMIIRSSSTISDSDDPRMHAFQEKAAPIFVRFLKYDEEKVNNMGVMDYINLYSDYLALKAFVFETDEDMFPTIVEALVTGYGVEDSTGRKLDMDPEEKLILQNVEHAALSGLVMLSKDLGRSIALYECAETEPQYLKDSEAKSLLQFYRGFIFFQAGYYYVSEEALSNGIDRLNANPEMKLPFTKKTFNWDNLNEKDANIAFHGIYHLMRGFDRLMMEREIDEERALQDFEVFIEDAKKVGFDNELVWVVEAYLYMKREESEKAIVALKKLKGSYLLSSKEKKAVSETIDYLDDREPGKALNKVYDNVFMGRIIVTYMLAKLKEVDWEKLMKENEIPYTNEIFHTVHSVQDVIQNIDTYTNTDTIANVGKKVGKEVIDGVEKEGKNLWDKAKDWWEE